MNATQNQRESTARMNRYQGVKPLRPQRDPGQDEEGGRDVGERLREGRWPPISQEYDGSDEPSPGIF